MSVREPMVGWWVEWGEVVVVKVGVKSLYMIPEVVLKITNFPNAFGFSISQEY